MRREEKMAKNTEKKTISCQEFYDLHPKIPLWIVLLFKECKNLDLTKTKIELMNDLLTSKGEKDKLILIFSPSLLTALYTKRYEYYGVQDTHIVEIIDSIIGNLTQAHSKNCCEAWTLSYQETPQNGEKVINLSINKLSNYLKFKSFDFFTFPLEIIDTNDLDNQLSHKYSLIFEKREAYLVNGYGKRCDKMLSEKENLFRTSIRSSDFHVDGPDNQTQSGGKEKLNFSHIHPQKHFAFYLIDNFFDIEQNHDNLWKHNKEHKKYNLPNEIKNVLNENNFVIPNDIN